MRRALMAPYLASPKTRRPISPRGNLQRNQCHKLSRRRSRHLSRQAPRCHQPPRAKMQELMSEMRALQTKIREDCRDVGDNFAEEARKIHYGEAEPEGIYGQATAEEREALDEEGIEIMDMPWLPKDN